MALNSKWTSASIIFFSIILGGLVLGIVYICIIIYYNPKLLDEQLIPLAGTLANLILATISIITMILNRKYTLESIKQTDETIQGNKSYNEQTLEQTNTMINNNRKYNEQTLEQTKKTT